MLRFLLIFAVVFVAMAANSDQNMFAVFGIDGGVATAFVGALAIAAMIQGYAIPYLVVAVVVAVAANLTPEAALKLGFERDYAIAALITILLTPRIVDHLDE